MESIDLDMDDIFDRGEDDGGNLPSTLPDLPQELEPLDGGDQENMPSTQDAENAEVLAKLKGMKGAGKKVVRHPQPKLDGARLTGERGIATLPKVFKDIKFKGRGHEADDLRVIMKRLEHWGHRLFPMMPFDDVLERIEKLGSKNDVKTCIKKMRCDIPILKEDFVEEEIQDEPPSPRRGNDDFDAEEAFDEIMREEQENRLQSQQAPPTPRLAPPTPQAATPISVTTATTVPNGLTPEQREKMERNRRLAMEKRAARLAAQQAQAQGTTNPARTEETGTQQPDGSDKNTTSDESKQTAETSGNKLEETAIEDAVKDGEKQKPEHTEEKMDTDQDGAASHQDKEFPKDKAKETDTHESIRSSQAEDTKSEELASSKHSSEIVPDDGSKDSDSGKDSSKNGPGESETVQQEEELQEDSSNTNPPEDVSAVTVKGSPDPTSTQPDSESSVDKTSHIESDNCEADAETDTPQGVETESFPVNRHTDMDTSSGLPFETEVSNGSQSNSVDNIESEGFSVKGGMTVEDSVDC